MQEKGTRSESVDFVSQHEKKNRVSPCFNFVIYEFVTHYANEKSLFSF